MLIRLKITLLLLAFMLIVNGCIQYQSVGNMRTKPRQLVEQIFILAFTHPADFWFAAEATHGIPTYVSRGEIKPITFEPRRFESTGSQFPNVDTRDFQETGRIKIAVTLLKDNDAENDVNAITLLNIAQQNKSEKIKGSSAYWLAIANTHGMGVPKNEKLAFNYFKQALSQYPKNADALYAVGRAEIHGLFGTKSNIKNGKQKLTEAAAQGIADAFWELGMLHFRRQAVETDIQLARQLVEKSARNGSLSGMISAAVMNALGQGGDVNKARSFYWYERAAQTGSAHAIRGLGAMLLNGTGVNKDEAAGIALLRLARDAGDINAGEILKLVRDIRRPVGFEGAVSVKRALWLERLNLIPQSGN